MNKNPEFDAYASRYTDRIEDPIKRLLAGGFDEYIALKVRWLVDALPRIVPRNSNGGVVRLLDYGCGPGEFLRCLLRSGFSGEMEGCDVSTGMLEQASQGWEGHIPPLHHIGSRGVPLPSDSFDIVVACCVFHHVSKNEREAVMQDIYRVLKPGGCLAIFEHNPRNPLTVRIVKRAPVDVNAELILPEELCRQLKRIRFDRYRCDYILFVPPRIRSLRWVDAAFRWLPFGGQYAITVFKPVSY